MRIILRQDYPELGKAGEIVEVKDGYARNYLIPRKIAVAATKSNLRMIEAEKKLLESRLNREKKAAQKLAQQLEKLSLTVPMPVGEEDRLFGSVTSQTVADLLKEKGFEIDKRKIELEEPIKALGIYTIPIKLYPDVEVKIKLWVVRK